MNQFKVGDRVEWCFEADFEKCGNLSDADYHDFGVVTKVNGSIVICDWDNDRKSLAHAHECRLVEQTPNTLEQDLNAVVKLYCQEITRLVNNGNYDDAKMCFEGLSAILKAM